MSGKPPPSPRKAPPAAARRAAPGAALLVLLWYAALVGLSQHGFWYTPKPLPADAPAATFSEARARGHARVLVEDCAGRQVSLPGLEKAHHYIIRQGRKLQAAAQQRRDLTVQVDVESHDGAFPITFMGYAMTNAYLNVTNINIYVAPTDPAAAARPAVMVVAHHDAPVSSPGAGDDAGNVGAMLEMASNLVATNGTLPTPVLFLFSGAEEPLCQSASAWMHHSKWAPRVGAFINLEALGPGGVPIVFQHAGAWTIGAYARGAAHPRGAISAQDIFDAGLVMGETDFSRLSYRHAGKLPGLDIAYLADGAAYHTTADTMARLRPGVLQEVGETLAGVVREMSEDLAARHDAAAAAGGDAVPRGPAAGGAAEADKSEADPPKAFFFSLGAKKMVVYSFKTARALHPVPLAVGLSLPWALPLLAPAAALPPAAGLAAAAGGAARALGGLLLAPAAAAAFGVARALLSGVPMAWFSQPRLAAAIYLPFALAAQLALYSSTDYHAAAITKPAGSGPGGGAAAQAGSRPAAAAPLLAYHVLGGALTNAAIAAALTPAGVGMSCVFAIWAAGGVLAAPLALQGPSARSAAGVLLCTALPAYACCELALAICMSLVGRMSLTGHVFVGLGDAVAGLLFGIGSVAIMGGIATPLLAASLGRRGARRAAAALALFSLGAAVYTTARVPPYSAEMPKRLLALHLHHTEAVAPSDPNAGAGGAAHVVSKVTGAEWALAGADSTPLRGLLRAMRLPLGAARKHPAAGNEWSSIYPISELLEIKLIPTQPLSPPPVKVLPYVRLVSEDTNVLTAADGGGSYRDVEFEVFTERPCWGLLNVTSDGGVLGWSLTNQTWPRASAPRGRIVRWTSQRAAATRWRVRVRVGAGGRGRGGSGQLRVQLHIDYLQTTPQIAALIRKLPPWGTMTYQATGYISDWVL